MKDFQQRVIDEKTELDAKLKRLVEFVKGGPVFDSLHPSEQDRLHRQSRIMTLYSEVLRERIEAFKS